MFVLGLSVHGFIEALLSIAKKRCAASETLVESFQRLTSSCHAALEDERRRVASLPRLHARRQHAPSLSGRRSADVVSVSSHLQLELPRRFHAHRSVSSGSLYYGSDSSGGERANSSRRIDRRQFVNASDGHKNDRETSEH